ncbi:MAG TPA: ferritin-like domain-containing protein [Sedimentisphaerales bacterium]|nr:ferritin-like domain-containing protein [Sedimentisphaerales bacterium]
MGTKGRAIVGMDIKELLKLLNRALADEWLAYYQYWVGSKIAVGRMRGIIAGELEEHANEELEHANKLTDRIIQLGGTPITNPEQWKKESNCGYDEPVDPNTRKLVEQNIKGEQCAIEVYKKLLAKVEGKDPITARLILEILTDEVEHEDDLEAILEDMKTKVN